MWLKILIRFYRMRRSLKRKLDRPKFLFRFIFKRKFYSYDSPSGQRIVLVGYLWRIWFVFKLKMNEFHPVLNCKLGKFEFGSPAMKRYLSDLSLKRWVAHRLDIEVDDLSRAI